MKILGLILIFASSTAQGFIRASAHTDALKRLRGLIDLLYFIKREISSYLTPQGEIFEKFRNRDLEKCGFLEALRGADSLNPLYQALGSRGDTLLIKREAFDTLLSFSKELGCFSPEEECARCDRAIAELEDILKIQKEETAEKTRLCRTVGAMVGMGAVLMLW